MIAFPSGARVWLAGGVTDMRKGINGLTSRPRGSPSHPSSRSATAPSASGKLSTRSSPARVTRDAGCTRPRTC